MAGTVLGEVVLSQFLPYLVGGHAHNRVLPGVKVLRKLEERHAERTLLEIAARTIHRVLDDVFEKLPTSLARAKRRAFQQTADFRAYGVLLRLVQRLSLPYAHPG